MDVRNIDRRIDNVWEDVFTLLLTHQSDFISSNDDSPTNEDRQNFIKTVREKTKSSSRIHKFISFISTTKFYAKLYRVTQSKNSMEKIKSFCQSATKDFRMLSREERANSLQSLFSSRERVLITLCEYLYSAFIDRKGVKEYYFGITEDSETIKSNLIAQAKKDGCLCPYCGGKMGNGDPDHFLPKSLYPLLALYSKNIILCCKNCNMGLKSKEIDLPIVYPSEIDIIKYVEFQYKQQNIILKALSNSRWQRPVNNYLSAINIIELYNTNKYRDIYMNLQKELAKSPMALDEMEEFLNKKNDYYNTLSSLENKWERKIRKDFISQLRKNMKPLQEYTNFQ